MKLPAHVLQQFRDFGKAGGHARAQRLPAASRRRIARVAALARWTRERFGVRHFVELGLPGADLVDKGLEDVAGEVESVEGLMIAIAAPRLRREGVTVPAIAWPDPEMRCYRRLEEEHGEMAHARYGALQQQVRSFADACYLVRQGSRRNAE